MPLDPLGKPVGSDFVCFWTASQLALSSRSAMLYRPEKFYEAEEKTAKVPYPLPWQYPPTFLLMILPLALVPYLVSLFIFLALTLAAYLLVLRFIAPHRLTMWLALAFPATFQNVIHGQNGFLSAALLGGGLSFLDSRPVLAGVLLGFLTYKPHMAALVPFALVAGRHWKSLCSMAVTTACFVLLSAWVFGYGLWVDFLANVQFAARLLTDGSHNLFKMPTIFAATLLAGGDIRLATGLQVVMGLTAGVLVTWAWYRGAPLYLKSALLVTGILMVTPHAFEYDLTILALPLAWFCWHACSERDTGRPLGRTEELIVLLAWLTPLVTAPFARLTSLQLAPLFFAAFVAVLLRCLKEIPDTAGDRPEPKEERIR